jgi:hypothetical protein
MTSLIKNKTELLVARRLGEFAQDISNRKVLCLRDLLERVFSITAPISCDIAVFKSPIGVPYPSNSPSFGKWYGVSERTVTDLQKKGYPKSPINKYLEMHNNGKIQDEYRLDRLLSNNQVVAEPASITIGSQKKKTVLLIAVKVPIKLVNARPGDMCCLILINPIFVLNIADQDKRPERIEPISDLIEAWLAWVDFQRVGLREEGQGMLREDKNSEVFAKRHFGSLIRLNSLRDIITFANQGLFLHSKDYGKQTLNKWLEDEIVRFITPTGTLYECWHNCLQYPWPPCHQGTRADRVLAKTLLNFCPWTSGALNECSEIPKIFGDHWREILRDRLWGNPSQTITNHFLDHPGVNPKSLNETSLTRLFVAEFLEADLNASYINEYTTGKEKGRYLAHLGRVLHYLLAGTPLDWSTIEGLVWMISEYGHRHLKIDPRLDISSHLLQAARAEPALHAMQAYYRDHFFHAIEVCFLGHLLLLTKDQNGQYLWQHVAANLRNARHSGKWLKEPGEKKPESPNTLEDVLRQWYLASLFHDVGYVIQVFSAATKMLEFYPHASEMKVFQEALKRSHKNLSDSIRKSEIASILELSEIQDLGEDHGVIAAIHLKSLIDKLSKDKYPGNYFPAIRAIGLHNERHAKVSFQKDPLGVLLILCDTIQEWNRPHLRFTTAPSMLLARLMGKEEELEDTTGPLDTVSLNVTRSEDSTPRPRFQIESGGDLKILLVYDEQIRKDSGVFNLWVDSSCNLQRLCLDSLPFNIKIILRTPLFRLPGQEEQSQLDRLRDAATETHMHFLHDWLPNSTISDNGKSNVTGSVILYSDKTSGCDELTLDIRLLSRYKTIAGNIHQFHERLQTWKRWGEDRDFEGDYSPVVPGK